MCQATGGGWGLAIGEVGMGSFQPRILNPNPQPQPPIPNFNPQPPSPTQTIPFEAIADIIMNADLQLKGAVEKKYVVGASSD